MRIAPRTAPDVLELVLRRRPLRVVDIRIGVLDRVLRLLLRLRRAPRGEVLAARRDDALPAVVREPDEVLLHAARQRAPAEQQRRRRPALRAAASVPPADRDPCPRRTRAVRYRHQRAGSSSHLGRGRRRRRKRRALAP